MGRRSRVVHCASGFCATYGSAQPVGRKCQARQRIPGGITGERPRLRAGPPMSATQALSIFIHGRGVPEEQHVEWALSGAHAARRPADTPRPQAPARGHLGVIRGDLRGLAGRLAARGAQRRRSPPRPHAGDRRRSVPRLCSFLRPAAPPAAIALPSAPVPASFHRPHVEAPPIAPPVSSGVRTPRSGESRLNSVRHRGLLVGVRLRRPHVLQLPLRHVRQHQRMRKISRVRHVDGREVRVLPSIGCGLLSMALGC